MSASFPASAAASQPSKGGRAALAVVGIAVVSALLLAGLTFFGLAIAFPIAIPVAEHYNLPVKASDLEIARQFAPLWWVFAIASVASFAAALVTIVKLIGRVSPVEDF